MSAVHLALKARLLPDRVVRAELWGDHPRHRGGRIRKDKRLEYRPTRVRVRWIDRQRNRKERSKESETPIVSKWRQHAGQAKFRRERILKSQHLCDKFETEMKFNEEFLFINVAMAAHAINLVPHVTKVKLITSVAACFLKTEPTTDQECI